MFKRKEDKRAEDKEDLPIQVPWSHGQRGLIDQRRCRRRFNRSRGHRRLDRNVRAVFVVVEMVIVVIVVVRRVARRKRRHRNRHRRRQGGGIGKAAGQGGMMRWERFAIRAWRSCNGLVGIGSGRGRERRRRG